MTSRLSSERDQKCAVAGIPVPRTVSAPTSAAVGLIKQAGITLAAFISGLSVIFIPVL
ncbi:formate dehydrogenase accessory sulfurtransferase FdhD [Thioclava sp. F36-7]|uniref:formate dehydrogenase accessory sulfurtransferase FdhD n=1 Tax=Thioclava sp. F36-7 TaxID=1915317 RepID=UPI001FEF6AA2|nr:formate dehydrogenase accessory sulfurtransferase FdhD [Thioclava sp. F36-7]